MGVAYYLWAYAASYAFSCVFFSIVIAARRIARLGWQLEPAFLLHWLRLSLPFAATFVITTIYFKSDLTILPLFRPYQEVGWYGFASKPFEALLFLPVTMLNVVFPVLGVYFRASVAQLQVAINRFYKALFAVGWPASVGVVLLAPGINALFDRTGHFGPATPALQILGSGIFLMFITNAFIGALNAADRQHLFMWTALASMVANVALNLALIPSFGYLGAAWAANLTELVLLVVGWAFVAREIGRVPVFRLSWRIALAGAVMGAALLPFRSAHGLEVLGAILVGVLVYGVALVLVRAFDTEVIVHGYEEWGPECFSRFNGMWAAAIVDRRNGAPKLVLARDHFGIKPLYWARAGGRLLFASEIKAFFQEPAFSSDPDPQRIHDYLTLGFHDRRDESFFKGVHQLPAAHYAVVDAGGMTQERYWQPVLASDGSADPQEFRRLFEKAVERRLVAEVPVGTCLSGGLDSSAIVCFMSELLEKHVPDAASMGDHLKTFSAVFDGDPIDERDYIDLVLEATGAEKNFVHPTAERFLEELDRVVWHQEEPMVSTGPYAQWCVMRKAQGEVTVLLDGQCGDELLAGYVPYQFVYLRQLLRERRFGRLLAEAWAARDVLWPLLRRRLGERGKRFPAARLIRDGFRASVQPARDPRVRDDLKRRLLQDLTEFSLPSLLRYEDRNSMAFSMESRPPYLDQELVEWILRLPETAIVDAGWSRAIRREGLRGVPPEKIRTRRWKVGFTTPEFRWLRAERAWVQGLLRSPAFCARPYWDGLALADAFDRVCNDRLEEHPFVWRALNTGAWLRVFFSPGGGARAGRRGGAVPAR